MIFSIFNPPYYSIEENKGEANPALLMKFKELMDEKEIIRKIMDKYDKEAKTEDEYAHSVTRATVSYLKEI